MKTILVPIINVPVFITVTDHVFGVVEAVFVSLLFLLFCCCCFFVVLADAAVVACRFLLLSLLLLHGCCCVHCYRC